MRKKTVWLLVSSLMAAALVLASCGPADEEEEVTPPPAEEEEEVTPPPAEEEEEAPPQGPEMVRDALGRLVEKPKYGGTFNMAWAADVALFDDALGHPYLAFTTMQTHDVLLQGDWAQGPAGTGKVSWAYMVWPEVEVLQGAIAETWEMPDENTLVFHIRKGVYFHDKPPTNGREVTADDVAFTLNRLWTAKTSIYLANPYIESIEATDDSTVVVKSQPGKMGVIYRYAGHYPKIMPRDAIEQFGNMAKWENTIGTGPFILVDFVSGSSATLERNPNYWDHDPLLPQNQLPYLDTIKYLIIPDLSTQLAGMRTGRIDWLPGVMWEDAASLMQTNPELKYVKNVSGAPPALMWRVDKPDLPFYDIRVRQALFMAVDHEAIANEFYGGHADIHNWPAMDIPEFADFYIPVEERSEIVGEMYSYHPDKAQQLLTEAGYPEGFKTSVVCYTTQVDLLSIVKEYWAKVGVELELDVKEYGAYTGYMTSKAYDIFMSSALSSNPEMFSRDRIGNIDNYSMIADDRIEAAYAVILENFFNAARKAEAYREIHPYMLEQAYYLVLPGPADYTFWQPWMKNYHGERYVGTWAKLFNFPEWIWIDEDLKYEMTGRR